MEEEKEMVEWVKTNKAKLEMLIKHSDEIVENYEYEAAKRLVWATWRKAIIGLSGLLVAIAVLYDNIKAFLAGLLKGLTG